ISIIIVCFPGAPRVSQEALQQEAELEQQIDVKVEEIIQMMRTRDEDPDLLYVIKFLAAEEMPGLPPGGEIFFNVLPLFLSLQARLHHLCISETCYGS
uniref:Protein serine/threonine phosphatase 2C C-terminal domain-containing protein n=1 Tax=Seriola lalandi dorsalis TaxID=1841481 RepID=A0A3B4WR85_SERLL